MLKPTPKGGGGGTKLDETPSDEDAVVEQPHKEGIKIDRSPLGRIDMDLQTLHWGLRPHRSLQRPPNHRGPHLLDLLGHWRHNH